MGLLKLLFGNQTVEDFIPDFTLPEYDNWLNFLEKGGTDKEWKRLKVKKDWKFRKSRSEIFIEYQKELKPVSDKYYAELKQLESDWSAIYNSKKYDVEHSRTFEIDCKKNIALFKQMAQIEKRHGDSSPPNVPAYKRLAMLYEKRGLFEESAAVCVDALQNDAWGDGMQARLARMIKKANRQPTEAELFLIEKDFSIKKSNLNFKN